MLRSPKRVDVTKNVRRRLEKMDGTHSETGSYSPPLRHDRQPAGAVARGRVQKDACPPRRLPGRQHSAADGRTLPVEPVRAAGSGAAKLELVSCGGGEACGVRGPNTFLGNIEGPKNKTRYFFMIAFVEQRMM